jgi:hypothetical protein
LICVELRDHAATPFFLNCSSSLSDLGGRIIFGKV